MSTLKDPPGSSKAVAQGCICSPTLNRHGHGTLHGRPRFYFHPRCPIHRTEAEQQARERGDVWVILRSPNHDDEAPSPALSRLMSSRIAQHPANGQSSGSTMMAAVSWTSSAAKMRGGRRYGTRCESTGNSERC